ncbi:MAG: hypothetical protein JWM59_1299 [Verrucomicrobiales bacterium]|nr:hypothetical protein [Verrucomicrobiales bacterium]
MFPIHHLCFATTVPAGLPGVRAATDHKVQFELGEEVTGLRPAVVVLMDVLKFEHIYVIPHTDAPHP